jgi:hypothetical protein
MRPVLAISTLSIVLLTASVSRDAFAQTAAEVDRPSEAELAEALGANLPPWWDVAAVDVRAVVDDGDAVDPRLRLRLEAEATAATPLYLDGAEAGRAGPFAILVETQPEGASRTLYAVLQAQLQAGAWEVSTVSFEPELRGLGRPRDMFTRPSLVAGSPEAEAAVARVAAAEELAAALAAERAARMAAFERELADLSAAHAANLRALETAHAAAVREIEIEQARALAVLEEASGASVEAARLAARKAGLEQEIAALDEVVALETSKAERLAALDEVRNRALEARRAQVAEVLAGAPGYQLEMIWNGSPYEGALAVRSFDPETGDVVADFTYQGTTCAVTGPLLPASLSLTGEACALKLNLAPAAGGKNEGPATIGGYDFTARVSLF